MAYLLDTRVVSELRKPRPHGAAVAWLQSVDDAQRICLFHPFAPATRPGAAAAK